MKSRRVRTLEASLNLQCEETDRIAAEAGWGIPGDKPMRYAPTIAAVPAHEIYTRAREMGASHGSALRAEHDYLVDTGLLDPDEPTRWAHYAYQQRLRAEFTADERARIRSVLGWESPETEEPSQ